ncbi:MAG: Rieske (2Fe-2S) protein [Armatimonadetes bacterium]|nr:Rieske (2Fe-2S) protein [Armatimonadota bacterium]
MTEESPQPAPDDITRRDFFAKVCYGLGGFAVALFGVPIAGFVLSPLLQKPLRDWVDIGGVEAFEIGDTKKVVFEDASPLPWAGVTARTAAWLRRTGPDSFIAFSVNCTHLGCPVKWLPDADLFMCPCHGGVYYKDGTVAAGPPPHPLTTYPVRVSDGRVEIQTSPIPITTV